MSRAYEFYRERQEEADFNQEFEDEQWYYDQFDEGILKLPEIPSTEEDLFRNILEDERNEE